jgi:hypothetical protein
MDKVLDTARNLFGGKPKSKPKDQGPKIAVKETSVDDASSAQAPNPDESNTFKKVIDNFKKVSVFFEGDPTTKELLNNYKVTFLGGFSNSDKQQDLIKGFSDLLKAYAGMKDLKDEDTKAIEIVAAHKALSEFLTEEGIVCDFSVIDGIFSRDAQIKFAKEEADRKAKEEVDRVAKEEADRKAKEEADRKAKEEAERKAKEEADRKAKEEADRVAKEEADRKAKEETSRLAQEEADRKAKEEADRKAKEEADRKAKEEADRKAKEEAAKKAQEEADRKAKEEADRLAQEEADRKAKEEADRKAKEEAIKEAAEAEVAKKAQEEAKRKEAEAAKKAKIEEFARNFISKPKEDAIKEAVELRKSPLQKLKDKLELLIAEEKAAQEELEAKLKDVETANEELMKARKEVSIASLELKKLKLKDTRGKSLTNREAETYKQKDYSILDKDISEKEKELEKAEKKAEKKAQEAAEANKHFDEALGAFDQKSEEAKEQAERIEGYEARFSDSIAALKKAFSDYVKEMITAQNTYDNHTGGAKKSILAELVKLTKLKFTSDLQKEVAKILDVQGANEGVVVQVSSPVNDKLLNLSKSISDLLSKTCDFVDSTMYKHNKSLAQPKKSQDKDVMEEAFKVLKGALAQDLDLENYKAGLKQAKYSDEKIVKLEAKLQEVWGKFKAFASDKEKAIENLFRGFNQEISSEAESYKACATEATEKLKSAIAHHNIIAEFMGENCFHLGGMINGAEHIALEAGLSREGMVEGAIAHKECLGEDLALLF